MVRGGCGCAAVRQPGGAASVRQVGRRRLVVTPTLGAPVLLHARLEQVLAALHELVARGPLQLLREGVVPVVVVLDDLERPAAADDVAPTSSRSIRSASSACPASRSWSTASPRSRSALPVSRWNPYSSPRACSIVSRAADSVPSASTVASETPSGTRCCSSGPCASSCGASFVMGPVYRTAAHTAPSKRCRGGGVRFGHDQVGRAAARGERQRDHDHERRPRARCSGNAGTRTSGPCWRRATWCSAPTARPRP